ncbi:MAG: hypothetical protein L0H54_13030 [Alcaligenaceae bacterium]|nr:hypothetical protein [Alcaligenaceae bacterium]
MSIQKLIRYALMLCLAAAVSGCSLLGLGDSDRDHSVGGDVTHSSACAWSPGRCMYEGRYEPGEAAYAEREARRLNRAALERLRRNAIK